MESKKKKKRGCAPTCGHASVTSSWLGSATARLLVAACVGILVEDGIDSMESVRLGYRAISWRMVFLFTLQRPSPPRPMGPAHFTHPRVQCSIMRRGRISSVNDIQVDTATTIATEGEGGAMLIVAQQWRPARRICEQGPSPSFALFPFLLICSSVSS